MSLMFLYGLIYIIVLLDSNWLKQQDVFSHQMVFNVEGNNKYISALFYTVFLPVYLIRRRRFNKQLKQRDLRTLQQSDQPEVYLMSNAAGIVLDWFVLIFFFSVALYALEDVVPLLKPHVN